MDISLGVCLSCTFHYKGEMSLKFDQDVNKMSQRTNAYFTIKQKQPYSSPMTGIRQEIGY
ncbi:hypothetical protein BFO01nite_48430 [Brevibacillus formosus]|uniref:Uncharacterized protein n=1 Tax=Brevibacillus formosus TaxID=54913 RepID=A0ABQ0TBL8_9BACL|nr:hypothetical protein BFO01nite_48430 [Brevibacillus formosus]